MSCWSLVSMPEPYPQGPGASLHQCEIGTESKTNRQAFPVAADACSLTLARACCRKVGMPAGGQWHARWRSMLCAASATARLRSAAARQLVEPALVHSSVHLFALSLVEAQ